MVLAASGVHHEELTEIAKSLLEDLPGVKAPKEPKSYYVGGEYRKRAASEVCLKERLIFYFPCICRHLSLSGCGVGYVVARSVECVFGCLLSVCVWMGYFIYLFIFDCWGGGEQVLN